MNINKISGHTGISETLPQRGSGGDKGFGKVLDKAMGNVVQTGADGGHGISGASPISPIGAPEMVSPSQNTFKRAHKILDLMDKYANALGDPTRTLRSIEPIVREIQAEVKDMPADTSSGDGGVKKIVNDIAVMASVEALKFHRGDYVS
jgi:hypothetical protein